MKNDISELQAFIEQIEHAGVVIEGREKFIADAKAAASWRVDVTEMAHLGLMDGVRLTKRVGTGPSTQDLDAILRSYKFTREQRLVITNNIILTP